MNAKRIVLSLVSFALLAMLAGIDSASGQTTAFTYQGRLTYQGTAASGNWDLTFGLFDAASVGNQIGSTLTNLDVAVSNGLFTVSLDFGASAFPGADRWLELGVRTNSNPGAFTTLIPRQPLTPAPYAVTATTATTATTASGGWPTTWAGSAITSAVAEAAHATNADNVMGSIADPQLSANVPLLNGTNTFSGTNVFNGVVKSVTGGVEFYMVPQGAIVLWSGSVANVPDGWALCDGTQGTPNLTDKFVVGAGNTYAVADTGGAASHTHNVAMGGSATDSAGAHTHALSGSTDAVADHTHTGPSHTHTSAAHTHTVASHNHTGGDLAFSRQYASSSYTGGGSGGYYISVQSGTSTVCLPNSSQWQGHTGGTALTTDSTTPGATGSAGTGATGAAGGHAHTLTTASAASAGAHTHTVSFTVSSDSADSRPPYYALCYIMKL